MAGEDSVKVMWLKAARAAQHHCRSEQGYAVFTMKLLIGPGGEPVFWFQPEIKRVEPLGNPEMFLQKIFESLVTSQ